MSCLLSSMPFIKKHLKKPTFVQSFKTFFPKEQMGECCIAKVLTKQNRKISNGAKKHPSPVQTGFFAHHFSKKMNGKGFLHFDFNQFFPLSNSFSLDV